MCTTQIGYRDERWEAVETGDFRRLTALLADVKENSLVMAVTGNAGTGKTFACKQFVAANRRSYMLCCNEYCNRRLFLPNCCRHWDATTTATAWAR